MARTALAVQQILRNNGAAVTMVAADAANGMVFPNDGNTELIVKNADASAKTVTVRSVPCSHGRSSDLAVSVAAGATAILGPFDQTGFNQSGTDVGNVYLDFSAATSVTVGARKQ